MRHAVRSQIVCTLAFIALGCSKAKSPAPSPTISFAPSVISVPDAIELKPGEKPTPPLALTEPAGEPREFMGVSLDKALPSELARLARETASRGDYGTAVRCQYWYAKQSGDGHYDLACYYARNANPDAAFYWLQYAAMNDGVDPDHAGRDEDFASLHTDPRWTRITGFLQQCGRYWETQGSPTTTLIVPKSYTKDRGPIAVIAWLHGMGSNPQNFVDPADEDSFCQQLADELNVAFVGVSGTVPRGKKSFVWAEDPARDLARVNAALAEIADRVAVKPAGVIAFGFSQGAQTGAELAARHPEILAGAIVLSPGSNHVRLAEITEPSPLIKERGFVFGCGEREHPGNRMQTDIDAKWAQAAGAKVKVEFFRGQQAHSFPAQFLKLFPEWVRFIQNAQKPAKS